MPAPESILTLARKLQALIAPGSNASPGERQNAADALNRLLTKHDFTLTDLADETTFHYRADFDTEQERQLFSFVVYMILDVTTFNWGTGKLTKAQRQQGKSKPPLPPYFALIHLTRVQMTDITNCYEYYHREYRRTQKAIRQRITDARAELAGLATAMAAKYNISSTGKNGPAKILTKRTPEELAALNRALNQFKAAPWSKPTAELEDQLALTGA